MGLSVSSLLRVSVGEAKRNPTQMLGSTAFHQTYKKQYFYFGEGIAQGEPLEAKTFYCPGCSSFFFLINRGQHFLVGWVKRSETQQKATFFPSGESIGKNYRVSEIQKRRVF